MTNFQRINKFIAETREEGRCVSRVRVSPQVQVTIAQEFIDKLPALADTSAMYIQGLIGNINDVDWFVDERLKPQEVALDTI